MGYLIRTQEIEMSVGVQLTILLANPGPQNGVPHTYGGSSHLSYSNYPNLGIPSHTCPKVCLLGDMSPDQLDISHHIQVVSFLSSFAAGHSGA